MVQRADIADQFRRDLGEDQRAVQFPCRFVR